MPGPKRTRPAKQGTLPPARLPDVVLPAADQPIEPRTLDHVTQETVESVENTIALWKALRPVALDFVETLGLIVEKQKASILAAASAPDSPNTTQDLVTAARDAHSTMTSLANLLEKISRCGGTMVKMSDELLRLRYFLTGDKEPDKFDDMPLNQLISIVTNVAKGIERG